MPVTKRLTKVAAGGVCAVLLSMATLTWPPVSVAAAPEVGVAPEVAVAADPESEPYRPYLHYSPVKNWMNDPNGLVYYRGVYHLFYQYNPFGNTWGNMSWGHATSTDLLHWAEQPLALPQDANADIFSGSIVVDHENTSGFGTVENPPLVAMYTVAYHSGKQAQALAYSTDAGQTWTKYAGNPVLDRNSNNFRDPHIFWYDGGTPASSYWVVATVEAMDHQVHLYKSSNLKTWTHLSAFGPANAVGGQWECPDLFPLAVDGDPDNVKWVMVVNLNPGAVSGGSGGQYFVGDFDGTTFTSESTVDFNTLPAGTDFAGFNGASYGEWTTNNQPGSTANGPFGDRPATGAHSGQLPITGQAGTGLVNSFLGGDAPTGTLESPEFTISRDYVNFLVGGGNHPWQNGTSTTGADPVGRVTQGFESAGWAGWTATGGLVGRSPATGATAGQLPVSGYRGNRLLNTFLNGDSTTGTLTSPPFTIDKAAISFLIGGGNHPWGQANPTAFNLVVNGQVVRSATGRESESTTWQGWDVSDLHGQQATLQAVDSHTGGWGHLLLDQITFTDEVVTTFNGFEGSGWGTGWTGTGAFAGAGPASGPFPGQQAVSGIEGRHFVNTFTAGDGATGTISSPSFTVSSNHINLLIGGGNHPWGTANPTAVNLMVNGTVVRSATGRDAESLDWVSWDVGNYRGQAATIQIIDQNTGSWGHLNVDAITFGGSAALPRSTATAVNLVVDENVVRSATGNKSETLDWTSWNVKDLVGQRAHISVVDGVSGTGENLWGHILADQFIFSDAAALPRLQSYGWLDWGRDFYAGVTFDNAPDDRRIMIAWMNNWDYANQIPTGQWRSAMALPRELALRTIEGRPQLVQQVVDQVGTLDRPATHTSGPVDVDPGVTPLPDQANGNVLKIEAVFSPGTAARFGLTVLQSADGAEGTPVLYDVASGRLSVDRTRSGNVGFHGSFASVESAPVSLEGNKLHLEIYLDRSSVEVFAQDGVATITDQIFPDDASRGISLVSEGGTARLESLTVTPLNRAMWENKQDITFGQLEDRTYGDPDFTIEATATSGLPVTFTADGPCTVTDATVHLTGTGTCTITAAQGGDDTYSSATNVTRTFTVAKRAQDITFDQLEDRTYGDPDFTIEATATSGLPVTFTADGPCTVTDATVHLTGTGTCTITAAQDGDDTYSSATNVTRTFTVAKAVPTIDGSDVTMPYGQQATMAIGVTANGAVPTGWVVLTSGGTAVGAGELLDGWTSATLNAKALPPGTHEVTITYAGDGSVADGSARAVVTVSEAAPRISRGRTVATYGQDTQIPVSVTAAGVIPTGTVELAVASQEIGSGSLSDGTADIEIAPDALVPSATPYVLDVHYFGDGLVAEGTRASVLVVRKAAPIVTGADVEMQAGKPATMTVEVSADGVVPTGKVALFNGDLVLGRGVLIDGVATAMIRRGRLPAADTPHTVTIRYGSDAFVRSGAGTSRVTVVASP